MEVRDLEAQQRLSTLIDRVCDRKNPALDATLLSGIKYLCRQSDGNVAQAWEALWVHLRAPHAQTRLLALLVCEQLFSRSRAFRQALLAKLSQVLEAVIGFRSDRPLPPPATSEAALREKALELLEAWNEEHGGRYKQLPMAVRYLRDTLQYRFPEIATRAAAAEAEQHAREEREQAALRVRLAALLAPSGEWRDGMDAAAELLIEMGECFAILEEQPGQQQQPAAGEAPELGQRRREEGAMPVAAAAVEGLEWEDVATEAAAPAAAGAEAAGADAALEQEGLAAYAASDAADAAAGTAEAAGGSTAAELEVVLETLAGLYRQLTNRTLPQVLEWLQVLGRVEPEGPQQEQARQAMLRSATELRGRLVAARERCDAASLDLEALLLQRRRREEQRQEEGAQQAAVAAAVQDLFGDSDGSDAGSSGDDAEEMQQAGQKKQTPGGRQHPQNTAAGPSGSRQPQPWQRQQARRRQAPVDDADNPYLHIVDPAAPRPLLQQRSPAAAAAAAAASAAAKAAAAGQQRRSSSLPVEVRRKLAEQAPVLPTGTHTMFWDSKTVPTFVSGHGLEVNNHWGAVDVHQELPAERIDELFMLPMPANQQRTQQQRLQQLPPPKAAHPQQQLQLPTNKGKQPLEQAAAGPAAAPAGGSGRQEGQLQWPRRQPAGASAGPAAGAAAGPSSSAAAAAGAEAAAAGAPDTAGDTRTTKRARRADERAYNEAVIGGALSDEVLARQLQEADAQQEQQAQQQGGGRGGRGGRGRGKKMSVRDRLASKLLTGSVVAAAVRDLNAAEGELRREKFSNRW